MEQEAPDVKAVLSTDRPFFAPPRPEDAPEDIRGEVMLGYLIMTQTDEYPGEYVGNDLTCSSCHFEGGRSLDTISLAGVGAVCALQFRSRQDYTTDLAMRTQDCFERSMNGRAPALDSQVMQSLLVYMQWISKGIPIYSDACPGRSPPNWTATTSPTPPTARRYTATYAPAVTATGVRARPSRLRCGATVHTTTGRACIG